jgi:hypothetical protein
VTQVRLDPHGGSQTEAGWRIRGGFGTNARSRNTSAIATQTLIDLGYTNIDNLDGGMSGWTASGRQLVQLDRQWRRRVRPRAGPPRG